MKLTHIYSASELIECGNTKILTDPWWMDGAFYGSWSVYPPVQLDYSIFDDLDAIYISHVHEDHSDEKTMSLLPKVPVYIHNFEAKFLKNKIERMGFEVIELEHGETRSIGDIDISIYAADNCNPEICGKFFGCGLTETKYKNTAIDTLSVISGNGCNILNTNDCPYLLSSKTLDKVMRDWGIIDLLLVGWAGAGAYPQCFRSMYDEEGLERAKQKRIQYFLDMAVEYINHSHCRSFMPFAGNYFLAGKHHNLNKSRGIWEIEETVEYLVEKTGADGFLLNTGGTYDVGTGEKDKYVPVDRQARDEYILTELSKAKYDFEDDEMPEVHELLHLCSQSVDRLKTKREEMGFTTETDIYIVLPEGWFYKISPDSVGTPTKHLLSDKYVTMEVDPRLLKRILQGPRYGHWNNAEIGSHIFYERKPDKYERGLYFTMSYFHA